MLSFDFEPPDPSHRLVSDSSAYQSWVLARPSLLCFLCLSVVLFQLHRYAKALAPKRNGSSQENLDLVVVNFFPVRVRKPFGRADRTRTRSGSAPVQRKPSDHFRYPPR